MAMHLNSNFTKMTEVPMFAYQIKKIITRVIKILQLLVRNLPKQIRHIKRKTTNVWGSRFIIDVIAANLPQGTIYVYAMGVMCICYNSVSQCYGWQLSFHKWPVYLICIFYPYIIVMYTTHQSAIYISTSRNSVM